MRYIKFVSKIVFYLFLFCNVTPSLHAQRKCELKEFPELFKSKKDSKVDNEKKKFFFVAPYLGYQPATGFSYGGITQYIFKGKQDDERFSEIYAIAKYSQKKQLLIDVVNNVYLKDNAILLNGDYRYYIFTQSNYGLGTDVIPYGSDTGDFKLTDIEQQMDYNYIRFHQLVSFRVKKNLYLGGGVHVDAYSKIKDKLLDVANGITTYHYDYNTAHNYDTEKYSVLGASINALYDSRDNSINASKGTYVNFNYRFNPAMGSSQGQSGVLLTEFRHYFPLSKTSKQHVLAFWAYGQYVTSGTLPYLNLPAVGWDQRGRQGKGYTQGLFRGNNLVSFETEYRFPILCSELVSGTVFTNVVTVSDQGRLPLFHTMQPALGIGLRVLLDKGTRTNIILNYAQGHKSSGYYLNTDESF
ncbi:MAG: BamA/TamA family outer membrane protein [Flavobacterium sp.]|nr:BamA/TamA family outer membrane protein [Flavobacterium sp.]